MSQAVFPTRQHERLADLIGTWEGPVRTWFDPDSPVKEARYRATFRAVAGGHAVLQEYQSSLDGEPLAGCALFAYDETRRKLVVSWVDSFHSPAPMRSEGDVRRDALVDVLGSYAAGAERWGWRTVLQLEAPDRVVYRAHNIFPDGREYLALEAELTRVP